MGTHLSPSEYDDAVQAESQLSGLIKLMSSENKDSEWTEKTLNWIQGLNQVRVCVRNIINQHEITENSKTSESLGYDATADAYFDSPKRNYSLGELTEQIANMPIYFEPNYEGKLRDTFAGQILQGLISKSGFSTGESFLVEKSYSLADEMLKQRKIK